MAGRLRSALSRLLPTRRPPAPIYTDPSRERFVEKARLGRSRQVPVQGVVAGAIEQQGIWLPITRPEGLVLLTDLVWPIGAAVDRVVEECTKGGWDFEGLFQAKCLQCGADYDVEPEMCEGEGCFSEDFRPPDERQLDGEGFPDHGIRGLLERPNWEEATGHVFRTTKDLLKDAIYYSNVIGGWHWEVIQNRMGRPIQLWSVLSEYIRRVEDPSLTIGEWFCSRHREELDETEKNIKEAFYLPQDEDEEQPLCPTHHIPLQHTAWVQIDESDNIVSVWSAQELLADQPRARGLRIYARSKVLRVWAMGQIHRWQERYDLAALSGQRAPDQVNFIIGRTQKEVNDMMEDWMAFLDEHEAYTGSVWFGLGKATVEGETLDVKSIQQMGEFIKRDFIAWRAAEKEDIAMNLGVSFVFMGGQTAGQLGKPEELIQVSYDTIEENQSQVEEFMNGKLVPLFPEVTEWKWVMKPPAPEDEEKKARLAITLANAVRLLREAGANAKLDPQATFDFPIVIDGWEDRKEQPEPGEQPFPGAEPPGDGLPLGEKHGGPGPHPSGTPQSVHGDGGGEGPEGTLEAPPVLEGWTFSSQFTEGAEDFHIYKQGEVELKVDARLAGSEKLGTLMKNIEHVRETAPKALTEKTKLIAIEKELTSVYAVDGFTILGRNDADGVVSFSHDASRGDTRDRQVIGHELGHQFLRATTGHTNPSKNQREPLLKEYIEAFKADADLKVKPDQEGFPPEARYVWRNAFVSNYAHASQAKGKRPQEFGNLGEDVADTIGFMSGSIVEEFGGSRLFRTLYPNRVKWYEKWVLGGETWRGPRILPAGRT